MCIRDSDKAVDQAEAIGGVFCVVYVALDNFGLLNDAFGQVSGDSLLRHVSRRLTVCAGPKAEVCRITSGEFALIVVGDMAFGRDVYKRQVWHWHRGCAMAHGVEARRLG